MIYHPHLSIIEIILFSVWITFISLLFTLYVYDVASGNSPKGIKNHLAPFALMFISMCWLLACFGLIELH